MSKDTHVIEIHLTGLTLNLSQLILWDVTYNPKEILLIYDYDVENFRKKIKVDTSSKSTSRSIGATKKHFASDNESPR